MSSEVFRLVKQLQTIGSVLGFAVPDLSEHAHKRRKMMKFIQLYSTFMTLATFGNVLVFGIRYRYDTDRTNALDAMNRAAYHIGGFLVYKHLLLRRNSLRHLFDNIRNIKLYSNLNAKEIVGSQFLTPKPEISPIYLTIIAFFATAILETLLFDLHNISEDSKGHFENATFLQKSFDSAFYTLEKESIINNPIILGVVYIVSKFSTLAIDYCDGLSVILSFAISTNLDTVSEHLSHRIFVQEAQTATMNMNKMNVKPLPVAWSNVHMDLIKIRGLTEQTSTFITPLIIYSLMVNLASSVTSMSICITEGFWVNRSSVTTVLQYLIRTVVVINFVSGVYQSSNKILRLIEVAPESFTEALPTLTMLRANPIGIKLFDSFTITRSFLISVLNFVFTMEIMVLQTFNSGEKSK